MPARLSTLLLLAAACGSSPPPPSSTPPPALPDAAPAAAVPETSPTPEGRLPVDVTPSRYRLELSVDPEADGYDGVVTIELTLGAPRRTIWLHGSKAQVVERALVAGQPAAWKIESEDGLASLTVARPVGPGKITVAIPFRSPYEPAVHGLFKTKTGGKSYAFTKFEPQSARIAFPCLDEPALKAKFEITLITPATSVALANTQIKDEQALSGAKRTTFVETAPLPTYLAAWAVGPFDVVERTLPATPVRGRVLKVRGVAAAGRGPELAYAVAQAQPIIEELEAWFGIPFPWDKVDLVAAPSYPSGAMENAGAIMFRESNLLVDGKTSSDEQRATVSGVIAHELAHEWFGNYVTMKWWDDLWLNEAFAEWMGVRVTAKLMPAALAAEEARADVFDVMGYDSLAGARAIRQPVKTSHDARNAFDRLTYTKGLGVLGMTERWLGAEKFQAGVRAYLTAHRYGNAASDDLFAALGEASGEDVRGVLGTYLSSPGVPVIDVTPACQGKEASLRLRQRPYTPLGATAPVRTWRVPFCAATSAGRACTLVGEGETVLPLPSVACGAWVHPNDDGAGYYRFTLPPSAWKALAPAWKQLSSDERLALLDAVRGSFQDGTMGFADAAPWLERAAAEPDRSLLKVTRELVVFALDHLLEEPQRPRARAWVKKIFAPALAKVKGIDPRPTDPAHLRLYRRDLADVLVAIARDPALRKSLAARAKTDTDLASELRPLALSLLVEEGEAGWQAVHARLKAAPSAEQRKTYLQALARTSHESLALATAALTANGELGGVEPILVLRDQMRVAATRAAVWGWVSGHLAEIAGRLPAQQRQFLLELPSGLCAEADAAALEKLAPQAETFVGGPRNLRAAAESIRLCAARADKQRAGTRAFFAR
jgi:cytosol alanyl aminopeptidase